MEQISVPDQSSVEGHCFSTGQVRLDTEHPYFSCKILQLGTDACVAVGLSQTEYFSDWKEDEDDEDKKSRPKHGYKPKPDGIVWYGDSGTVEKPNGDFKHYTDTFGQGDTVSLLVEYSVPNRQLVLLMKNGRVIKREWMSLKEDFSAMVNVWWGPAQLEVNWPSANKIDLQNSDLSQWLLHDVAVVGNGCSLTPLTSGNRAAQGPCPIGKDGYFEVTMGSQGTVAVGLGPIITRMSQLPGLDIDTIGYHSNTGRIYHEDPDPSKVQGGANEEYICSAGDRLGCGILYEEGAGGDAVDERASHTAVIYFTKNGQLVGHRQLESPMAGLYPMVGVGGEGVEAEVNMSAQKPSLPDDSNQWFKKKRGLALPAFSPQDPVKHDDRITMEEGETSGILRFAADIGQQSGSKVRPKNFLQKPKQLQCLQPFTPEQPFFTTVIDDDTSKSRVMVGVSLGSHGVGCMPGIIMDTAGYSNGGKICKGGEHKNSVNHAPEFDKGDSIGCLVDYFGEACTILFTRNDRLVSQAQIHNEGGKEILASLGFEAFPTTVTPHWPHECLPFPTFDQTDIEGSWIVDKGLRTKANNITYVKKSRKPHKLVAIAPYPLSKAQSYFQLKMSSKKSSAKKAPVVGVTNSYHLANASDNEKCREFAYNCRKNQLSIRNVFSTEKEYESLGGMSFGDEGDVIGFGIVYAQPEVEDQRARQVVTLYVTINGVVVKGAPFEQPTGGLYPWVLLQEYGDSLTVDPKCSPPPLPDLKIWAEEAQKLAVKILKAKKGDPNKLSVKQRHQEAAFPEDRPTNGYNSLRVYISYDPEYYNDMSYLKSGLDAIGVTACHLDRSRVEGLKGTDLPPLPEFDVMVACVTPDGYCSAGHAQAEFQQARERGKPIVPAVLWHVNWPPSGTLQHTLELLTLYKAELNSDLKWGIDQVVKKAEELKGKGYNVKEIKVVEGGGSKLYYSDAQRDNKTLNQPSDPNALLTAIKDADNRKKTSIGNSPDNKPTSGATSTYDRDNYYQPQKTESKTCVIL